MSELKTLYSNKTQVNAAMTAAGGTTIPTSGIYWSSAEISSGNAFILNLYSGNVGDTGKSNSYSHYYARCAVAY